MMGAALTDGDFASEQIYSGVSFFVPVPPAREHSRHQPMHLSSVLAFKYHTRNLISSVSQEIVCTHIFSLALG